MHEESNNMQKYIKEFKKEGIVQITVQDERWYWKPIINPQVPSAYSKFVPSVTWICSFYPKGKEFYKWLASKGWDEAEAIKISAGDKGSKIHAAVCDLIDGKEIPMTSQYINNSTEKLEQLSLEEYEALIAFKNWFETTKPRVIDREFAVFSDEYDYAGTVDMLCEIDGEVWLIDLKTGQNIWPEYHLQLSAYKHAMPNIKIDKVGVLQVGYKYNKNKYKLTEIEDKFNLFLAARVIWNNETFGVKPLVKDLPESIKLMPFVTESVVIEKKGRT